MRGFLFALTTIAVTFSTTASAQWKANADDDNCEMFASWELGTSILVQKSKSENNLTGKVMDDDVIILLSNEDWVSLKRDGREFRIRFDSNDGAWIEAPAIALDKALLIYTEVEHLGNLDLSSGVEIKNGNTLVGTFSWGGYYSAWKGFERCISNARAPFIEAERKERLRRATPKDPFAP